MSTASKLFTAEDLLALPDDGVERWLVKGQLREKRPDEAGDASMTIRNRFHSRIMAALAKVLGNWRDRQPEPRGDVLCGEAGVRLSQDPETTVGLDVGYIDANVLARQTDASTIVEGIPLLVVEILSPNDTTDEIEEKINVYLDHGVPLVWVINPIRRIATVFRPGMPVRVVNENEELDGEEVMPDLRVRLAEVL